MDLADLYDEGSSRTSTSIFMVMFLGAVSCCVHYAAMVTCSRTFYHASSN